MANEKRIPIREITPKKLFSYKLGNISFNAELKTDTKQDIKDFLELLEMAKVDIKAELESIK